MYSFIITRDVMKAYQETITTLIDYYHSNKITGLSAQEARNRLVKDGPNQLPEKKEESWVWVFVKQFTSPLIYILLAAATIIFFVGDDRRDAFIIVGILFFNAIIGTIQEGRTRSILASLKQFIRTDCIVLRDGEKILVDKKDLVVGDIIIVQEGQKVPADARIIESNGLHVDQAALTGESKPVLKTTDIIHESVPLIDQGNMLFAGTYILSGSGKALVVATAGKSQIGKVHEQVEEIKTDVPLRQELDRLSYIILIFILLICSGLFAIGLAIGKPLQELLIMLTALFICVVPEGLPVVLTLVLVAGVYRMAKKQVLVKNMQAVEGLGRTDVIVIDKTGTLTRNEMMVTSVWSDNTDYSITGRGYYPQGEIVKDQEVVTSESAGSSLHDLAIACYLLNTAEITMVSERGTFDIKGDPTEAALYVFAQKAGIDQAKIKDEYRKLYEIPFSSEKKYHAGFYQKNGTGISFIIGSPELILERSDGNKENAQQIVREYLKEGLRVVAVAQKSFDVHRMPEDEDERMSFCSQLVGEGITLLGICGMQDAIRDTVAQSIAKARQAGLKVIMATGDHEKTALFVAKKVGIFQEGDESIDGNDLASMSDQKLAQHLDHATVFSRVSPQDKQRIIKVWHAKHKIVAMTGDGINDAPSLVAADLGIGMGGIGTEVAKQAADLILLDDSFSSIISAIEQGRHIFYTLRRVILYFFSTNMGEILIVLFAFVYGLFLPGSDIPLPLTAAQILWLNLITDGFLDVALSVEPQEKDLLLNSDWLRHKLRLVDHNVLLKMLYAAIPMGIGSLALFLVYYHSDVVLARTMCLMSMALFQWFNAWNCRSESKSILQIGFFTNKWLIAATAFVLFLQISIVYIPVMQDIFGTTALSISQWAQAACVASSIIFLEEGRKWLVRNWHRSAHNGLS